MKPRVSEEIKARENLKANILDGLHEDLLGLPRPKRMKLICVDGVIIADAIVIVSHNDPNWFRPTGYKAYLTDDVVTVRRT